MSVKKGGKIPKETVRLFIALFISLFYALCKFSALSPSTPKIHSILLLFTGSWSLTVNNGDYLQLRIICALLWGSFAVLYRTKNPRLRNSWLARPASLKLILKRGLAQKKEYYYYSFKYFSTVTLDSYKKNDKIMGLACLFLGKFKI